MTFEAPAFISVYDPPLITFHTIIQLIIYLTLFFISDLATIKNAAEMLKLKHVWTHFRGEWLHNLHLFTNSI